MQKINPNNVIAVVQKTAGAVEVRYGDGKKPVRLTGTTTSEVMREIERLKREQADADSD